MQFINYFFASAISFLGLLIGLILTRIAPEEQKPLLKYFYVMRKTAVFLMFVFLIFYFINNPYYIFTFILIFGFLLIIEYKINDIPKKSMITYTVFGIIFFLSSKNTNLFAIESSLILLYGLPTASLIYNAKQKNECKLLFYNAGFVAISNALFLMT